jgi:hypothetical protein
MWRKIPGVLALLASIAVIGCSGTSSGDDDDDDDGSIPATSGVSSNKYLDGLSVDEHRLLCEWAISAQGGTRETQCDDDSTIRVYSIDECINQDLTMIHCTVAMLEACGRSLDGDPCRLTATQACATYIECASPSAS